jgi:glycosyltransferase involved in cell wall biosynthesis
MTELPLVSIGIPTYNRANLLGRAIESVLAQDYPNLELLICDNASTDNTRQVCEAYVAQHPKLRYIRQPKNEGATGNFRAAFENTRGEFFAWLGDDDWMDRSYVARCAAGGCAGWCYSKLRGRSARAGYFSGDSSGGLCRGRCAVGVVQ